MCKVQNRLMHFFRRISVKNITNQYINDWVKGLRICSSCAIARDTWYRYWVKVSGSVMHAMPEPTADTAGGMRGGGGGGGGGTAGGIVDTAGGSKYLRSGRG